MHVCVCVCMCVRAHVRAHIVMPALAVWHDALAYIHRNACSSSHLLFVSEDFPGACCGRMKSHFLIQPPVPLKPRQADKLFLPH